MKHLLPVIAVVSTVLTAFSITAEAAPWEPINQRQVYLDGAINEGIRVGTLTRKEAIVLRGEFNMIANLEAEYRRSGGVLTFEERADLDRRFTALSRKIRAEKSDTEDKADKHWMPMSERKAKVFAQIEQGVNRGSLTRAEAVQLRTDFGTIMQLEAEYRRSGGVFTMSEQADLERRLNHLSLRVMAERRDMERRF